MWPSIAVAATKPAAKQRLPLTQNPMVLLSSQHITSYERIRRAIMDLEQYAYPAKSSGRLSEALLDTAMSVAFTILILCFDFLLSV
ncbi:MAG: hypothetical protein WBE61_14030 [Nitrososphaeraceae archaeon]